MLPFAFLSQNSCCLGQTAIQLHGFFINGRRHHGTYDIETLANAIRLERAKVALPP